MNKQQLKETIERLSEGGLLTLVSSEGETTLIVYHLPPRLYWSCGPDNHRVQQTLATLRSIGYHLLPEILWNN